MRWIEQTPWHEILTPVQATAMEWTMDVLSDQLLEEMDWPWEETTLYENLPPRFRADLERRRFDLLLVYFAATHRIADPTGTMPAQFASPAEEILAFMFVQAAESTVAEWRDTLGEEHRPSGWPTEIDDGDLDFSELIEEMFEDLDFRMYYMERFDGFEENPLLTEALGTSDSMTLARLFHPYNPERAVHPFILSGDDVAAAET